MWDQDGQSKNVRLSSMTNYKWAFVTFPEQNNFSKAGSFSKAGVVKHSVNGAGTCWNFQNHVSTVCAFHHCDGLKGWVCEGRSIPARWRHLLARREVDLEG